MLLITPVVSPHTPVGMVVHDGLEIVVCPTMLAAAVVPVCIRLKKFVFAALARILDRLVPSTPISRTFGVSSGSDKSPAGQRHSRCRPALLRCVSVVTAASTVRAAVVCSGETGSDVEPSSEGASSLTAATMVAGSSSGSVATGARSTAGQRGGLDHLRRSGCGRRFDVDILLVGDRDLRVGIHLRGRALIGVVIAGDDGLRADPSE